MRSVKLGIVAASLLLGTSLSTPAFATGSNNNGSSQNHTCQGGHNCNTTTNNYDNDTYNTYNKGGEGGRGGVGYGGDGGDAKAYGGDAKAYGGNATGGNATGGNATGGNATNSNANSANNTNINTPIAHGGKGGDVDNHNYNDSHNKAYGGDAEVKNSGNSYNKNENEQKQKQQQQQQIKNSGNSYNENDNESSAYVNIEEHNQRAPVNTAYAAPLAVGEDTCMGSSSIGAQAVSFGLSIGTTWQDDNCRRLKNSRQLVSLGYHRAATSLMCVDEDVRQAMIMAGTPCPNGEVVAVVAPPPARDYVPMAPVADKKVRKVRKVRKPLPPK
jgi:hypothetical protein